MDGKRRVRTTKNHRNSQLRRQEQVYLPRSFRLLSKTIETANNTIEDPEVFVSRPVVLGGGGRGGSGNKKTCLRAFLTPREDRKLRDRRINRRVLARILAPKPFRNG